MAVLGALGGGGNSIGKLWKVIRVESAPLVGIDALPGASKPTRSLRDIL